MLTYIDAAPVADDGVNPRQAAGANNQAYADIEQRAKRQMPGEGEGGEEAVGSLGMRCTSHRAVGTPAHVYRCSQ